MHLVAAGFLADAADANVTVVQPQRMPADA
jgi:hypothetical protein